jgi:putative SOS response-associated peptidase YedK
LGEKISFKNLIKNYRCLVVADGYYEWKREKNIKTPHYFKRQDDEAIFFAAIFKTKQFCIVTREATSSVGDVHDRQPVIIDKKNLGHYLDLKNDGVDFLNSYKAPELKFHPVSKNVNVPTNNNENLILPK